MKDLRLRLLRFRFMPNYTEGILINLRTNKVICDVLEDRTRDINADGDLQDEGEGKVYGETSIPFLTYNIIVSMSPSFKKKTVEILNVPEFTGVRMHWGLTAKNSHGCPLCGKKIDSGMLANTGMTDKLVKLLEAHGGEGTLEII